MGLDKEPVRLTYALRMAKEYYKPETYGHALRVMQYVADNETIPYEYQEDCLALAVMHDLWEDTNYPRGCGLGENFADTLWSWSRYHCYKQDRWEYFLKYILHTPEDRNNSIYCVSGGNVHDIIEDLYSGKIKYEDMPEAYKDSLFTMNCADLKYNRSDSEKNDAIADKYENCIRHFFKNHQMIKYPHKVESFITIKISDKIYMQGYVDMLYIEPYDLYACCDDVIIIDPHKTVKVGTGLAVQPPQGYFGAIFARSGLSTKSGLRPANCVGLCDQDYTGEYTVALHNDTECPQVINPSDRIAQLVFLPYINVNFYEVTDLDYTARGDGGFGSTGR